MPERDPDAWRGLRLRGGGERDDDGPEETPRAALEDLPLYDGAPIPTGEPGRPRREDPDDYFDYDQEWNERDHLVHDYHLPWRQNRR